MIILNCWTTLSKLQLSFFLQRHKLILSVLLFLRWEWNILPFSVHQNGDVFISLCLCTCGNLNQAKYFYTYSQIPLSLNWHEWLLRKAVLCTFLPHIQMFALNAVQNKCWPSDEFLSSAVSQLPLPVRLSGTSYIFTYRCRWILWYNSIISFNETNVMFTITNRAPGSISLNTLLTCFKKGLPQHHHRPKSEIFTQEQTAHSVNFNRNLIWLFSYIVTLTCCKCLQFKVRCTVIFHMRGIFLFCTFKQHIQMKGGGDKTSTGGKTTCSSPLKTFPLVSFFFPFFFLQDSLGQRYVIFSVNCEEEMQNGWGDEALNRGAHLAVTRLKSRKNIQSKGKKTTPWFHPHILSCIAENCVTAIHLYVLVATLD